VVLPDEASHVGVLVAFGLGWIKDMETDESDLLFAACTDFIFHNISVGQIWPVSANTNWLALS
jgi:hypothetical protein